MEKYTIKHGKKLKYGYTTGSCAAAAASAAAAVLLTGELVTAAEITLPSGEKAVLPVTNIEITENQVSCAVIKDGGDDPDATHGAEICARVWKGAGTGQTESKAAPIVCDDLTITAGKGIGIVTAKGLQCKVGEPAINPTPRRMIFENVNRIRGLYRSSEPLFIEISVPAGEKIAEKTYNPRLGIRGGISILGTTGIVDPMSEKALIDTIKAVIDKQYAENPKRILIAPGNYGRDFCREVLQLDIEHAVPVSNYIGEALDYIKYKGFEEILFVGHTGKLIKTAAGIMNTHSSYADGRMEVLGVHSAVCGAAPETVETILNCVTTDDAFDLIQDEPYYEAVKARILDRVLYHLNFRLKGKAKIEVVMFTTNRSHMIKSTGADRMIETIRKDQEN